MGEEPYSGMSKMQIMFGVVSEGLRLRFPASTPSWYTRIAKKCWHTDPKRRCAVPSCSDLTHVLLRGLIRISMWDIGQSFPTSPRRWRCSWQRLRPGEG